MNVIALYLQSLSGELINYICAARTGRSVVSLAAKPVRSNTPLAGCCCGRYRLLRCSRERYGGRTIEPPQIVYDIIKQGPTLWSSSSSDDFFCGIKFALFCAPFDHHQLHRFIRSDLHFIRSTAPLLLRWWSPTISLQCAETVWKLPVPTTLTMGRPFHDVHKHKTVRYLVEEEEKIKTTADAREEQSAMGGQMHQWSRV